MARHSKSFLVRVLRLATKDKYACCCEAEEDRINGDDIIKYLIVTARKRDDDRKRALQNDSHDGHASCWMKPRDTFEKQAVISHRKIDARRCQHPLAQEAERRD